MTEHQDGRAVAQRLKPSHLQAPEDEVFAEEAELPARAAATLSNRPARPCRGSDP